MGDAITFDAKGGLHLVTPNGFYAFSSDGGKSWKGEPIPLPPKATVKTDSLTIDPAGAVHVAFTSPMTRPNPPAGKQGGYWQLRAISRMPDGSWRDAEDVLASAPGWKELQGPDDMLADWTRIAADNHGGLHVTWHGTTLSHAFSHDSAFYAWKKPGSPWSAPVSLMPPDPSRGVKYSFAPSLSLDGDRAFAMVFYDIYNGADWVGFDSSLVGLRNGVATGLTIPASQLVRQAIVAGRPKSAIGPRFPGVAPAPWHAANGQIWLDVLETMQSPFEPSGPNLIVYQRLNMGMASQR